MKAAFDHLRNLHLWIERASGWLVSCLSQFWGWKIPIQVGVWRGHSGISWIFNGVLFSVLIYRKSCGFFYFSTLSQLFPVFTPYSCKWRDCALGELLIFLGKLLMIHYFIFWFKLFVFKFQHTLNSKCQNISFKNVKQWSNSVISPLSCCAPL